MLTIDDLVWMPHGMEVRGINGLGVCPEGPQSKDASLRLTQDIRTICGNAACAGRGETFIPHDHNISRGKREKA